MDTLATERTIAKWSDFTRIEMHVGTVTEALPNPKAHKPAYVLSIDFGEAMGVRCSSAQLTACYRPEELVGKQVIAVTNFAPKRVAGIVSEVLVLAVLASADATILIAPASAVPNGARIA
jgi:tRNA-binding protein